MWQQCCYLAPCARLVCRASYLVAVCVEVQDAGCGGLIAFALYAFEVLDFASCVAVPIVARFACGVVVGFHCLGGKVAGR